MDVKTLKLTLSNCKITLFFLFFLQLTALSCEMQLIQVEFISLHKNSKVEVYERMRFFVLFFYFLFLFLYQSTIT